MGDRCPHCDERYSKVDPVHVCSTGPYAPVLPARVQELERDSQTYDAFTKGHEEGRIAGLKEALEIVKSYPPFSDISIVITARIKEIEER